MILLLGFGNDANLDYVIEWLRYYDHPYLRINSDDLLDEDIHLELSGPRLTIGQRAVDLEAIRAIWLRSFRSFRDTKSWTEPRRGMRADVREQLAGEQTALLNGLLALLADRHWLTHPGRAHLNKLDLLLRARRCGLAIPETHVVNRMCDVEALLQTGRFICKSLYEPMFVKADGGYYTMFTTALEPGDELVGDAFAPSLIQRLVAKQYELRVFYLDGECFTMAIFSQQRERSSVDFRNIDWTDPPRQVPYVLPAEIAERIGTLMTEVGLNTGSLDLIKGTDGEYYFLEVNPMGQFGMVAFPCNYPLYEKIALHLIQHDRA